jgi:hypothetical protein
MENGKITDDKSDIAVEAYKTYQEYYLRAEILEMFALNKFLSIKDLTWFVVDKSKERGDLHHSIIISDIRKALDYLVALGYICAYENEGGEVDNALGMITEEGMQALKNCTLQNLANTSFFGYKSLAASYDSLHISESAFDISEKALYYAKIAATGAIASVFLGLASIVLALCTR